MKKLLILNIFFIVLSCKVQDNINLKTISVKVKDYGKICLNNTEIMQMNEVYHFKKKHLTSSLYGTANNKEICFIINDKTFNYKYLKQLNNQELYGKTIVVSYKTYKINNKEIFMIYEITK